MIAIFQKTTASFNYMISSQETMKNRKKPFKHPQKPEKTRKNPYKTPKNLKKTRYKTL
jgi:hypothetical protein